VPSKKQSAAKPPDGTVFFIDRSLGIEPIRTELVKAGLVVEIHDDHFARDEEDHIWLKKVGERGWVVLTKDQRLRYRPLEIAALRASRARVFVLTAGNLRGGEIAAVFLGAVSHIQRILDLRKGPFVARISRSGSVGIT
jgi:predicted nuclease of predicted toxin-antitoxin system